MAWLQNYYILYLVECSFKNKKLKICFQPLSESERWPLDDHLFLIVGDWEIEEDQNFPSEEISDHNFGSRRLVVGQKLGIGYELDLKDWINNS